MSLVIRIPLQVQNLSALAGYFTDGPNFMALYGLVSQLETDANFCVERFGLVMESYASKVYSNELVTTGLDVLARSKQSQGARSLLGFRYADMTAALYLQTESLDDEDKSDLLKSLVLSVNRCRVQGGNLVEHVNTNETDRWGLRTFEMSHPEDLFDFLGKNESAISKLYLSRHLAQELLGEELLDAYAAALVEKSTLMVCNGYRQVGTVRDAQGQLQRIADGVYTLAQSMSVYELKALSLAERAATLNRFFWSFDREEHSRNPNNFILS